MTTFSKRELNTILAALRLWQTGVQYNRAAISGDRAGMLEAIATDGGYAPLYGAEIDRLCETLNSRRRSEG